MTSVHLFVLLLVSCTFSQNFARSLPSYNDNANPDDEYEGLEELDPADIKTDEDVVATSDLNEAVGELYAEDHFDHDDVDEREAFVEDEELDTHDENNPHHHEGEEGHIDTKVAAAYLMKYGYFKSQEHGHTSEMKTLSGAIKRFQNFVGLEMTGRLDSDTKKAMALPRCGYRDMDNGEVGEFNLWPKKWRKRTLKYKIRNLPRHRTNIPASEVSRMMRRAFSRWSRAANIRFRRVSRRRFAHIVIKFARGRHGDGAPFDGRGRVLAHAFFPGQGLISGNTHFDDDEHWRLHRPRFGQRIYSLEQVALHEFGHAIGLRHSRNRNAIMFPFVRDKNPLRLHPDDVRGARAHYGPPPRSTDPDDSQPRGDPDPRCRKVWRRKWVRCKQKVRPDQRCVCLRMVRKRVCPSPTPPNPKDAATIYDGTDHTENEYAGEDLEAEEEFDDGESDVDDGLQGWFFLPLPPF